MKFIRTCNDAGGKAVIAENREVEPGRPFSHAVPPGEGGRWLVVEFTPGQSTGWHAVHCDVYVYIVAGQLELALDRGESVTMFAGDLVVEGDNTLHSWTNTGDTPARVSAIEIDLS
ncbi:MAG TPA: cupin domain-containing protein [Dehalococcoidia bacterium]|nr:cupin domain-containing protein [Dehalococcoidia bacterium]